jgi:uncharacterized protein YchJ
MNSLIHCFTTVSKQISRVLVNDVLIAQAFNPKAGIPIKPRPYKAIWDTGASMSAVSPRIVNECALKQIGLVRCGTAGGIVEKCPVYLVAIYLPNKIAFPQLRVTGAAQISGADILVGMDIINSGDLFVTNFNGRTIFNFRMPSIGDVEFIKTPNICQHKNEPIIKAAAPGRNAPCPCGSGKKFKNCCLRAA